jgi:hypothetical protein
MNNFIVINRNILQLREKVKDISYSKGP